MLKKSIASQLAFITALPMIFLLAFGIFFASQKWSEGQHYKTLVPLTDIALAGSDVIQELQKERGRTVGLISSDYASTNISAIQQQRSATDVTFERFKEVVRGFKGDATFSKHLNKLIDEINDVPSHRTIVDAKNVSIGENVKFYTIIVEDFISVVSETLKLSPSEEVSARLLPYLMLIKAGEEGGMERAVGAAMLNELAKGEFTFNRFLTYKNRLSGEDKFLKAFRNVASDAQLADFDNTVRGSDVDQVKAWREVLLNALETKDGQGITGGVWFDTATKRLNLMSAVAGRIGSEAQQVAKSKISRLSTELYSVIAAVTVFIIGFGAFIAFFTSKLASRLKNLATTVREASDLTKEIEFKHTDREDEIGSIARAAKEFREASLERRRMREEAQRAEEARAERQRHVESLIETFRSEASELLEMVDNNASRMTETASQLTGVAEATNSETQNASAAYKTASDGVQTVAAASEELSISIKEITRQLEQADTKAEQAKGVAGDTTNQVNTLSEAATKIGDVVKLIQEIAEQTNLLALNATIEAARAGDAGKGFAVVATEVKQLASQTAKATDEISRQITDVQSLTENTVGAIDNITKTMDEIFEFTSMISDAVKQQDMATSEISESANSAAGGTDTATKSISTVQGSVEETTGMATHVLEASQSMKEKSKRLSETVDRFLEDVAAA